MKSGVFLVAFCARLKTYGALFGDKNHKAFSRFCLCGHEKSGLNPYVINLFDYASPSPQDLFDNWSIRDSSNLIFEKLPVSAFDSYILAYGDYEHWGQRDAEIKERQALLLSQLESLNEILLPKNNSGTPKHPMIWQRQKIKPNISALLQAPSNKSKNSDAASCAGVLGVRRTGAARND